MKNRRLSALFTAGLMTLSLAGCSGQAASSSQSQAAQSAQTTVADPEQKAYIEQTLNLDNNDDQAWSYAPSADAWVLSVVPAVAYPELPDQQGVSVCVPGAYVSGIDTDGDGTADVTAADAGTDPVAGTLVIDDDASITSSNGQTYTASTAPVVLNTGAAGYGSQQNTLASTTYAAQGYINVSCGNRGKQDTVTDASGETSYTGDAPDCLADQKAAARFVQYNILLGNLPGDPTRLVSTGGSGGGAHAVLFAATSNSPDFYDYQIEAGAVGIYAAADGGYVTTATVNGTQQEISDGAWGCIAYSPITSLSEADMALAFEYTLDADYDFSTDFQAQLAQYLSQAYMDYINDQNLTVAESDVGFDLDGDGSLSSAVPLTIQYDPDAYPETNGYYGSYLDLYLAEFTQNLQWYLDNLDYADDWTWFDENGSPLSDEAVAAMTSLDKAQAFLEGRYAKGSSQAGPGAMGGPGGEGQMPAGGPGEGAPDDAAPEGALDAQPPAGGPDGAQMLVGTPDAGTTQAAGSAVDSNTYASYDEMLAAYQADIAAVSAGDAYGNNQVELYNPLNYIGNADNDSPTWVKMMCGASEGDISLFNSLNLQIAMVNAGIHTDLEWQWDGGHVPSEVLGDSFSLYLDEMVGQYGGGAAVTKPAPSAQTSNGTAAQATGTDLTGWVSLDSGTVSFSLADAAAYRTAGASKAMPAFDVIDYGQEDYVFGDETQDARHWDSYLLEVLQTHADTLAPLFTGRADA